MLNHPIARLKHRIDLTLKMTVCGVVALAAGVVALGFFCAAAFASLAQHYDPIIAALVLGGAFVVLAVAALLVAVVLRRRNPPPPPPSAARAWWSDPVVVATALDVARTLGRHRMASAVLVGAFLVGMVLNRPSRPREP